MAEFSISAFTEQLRELLYNNFPYEPNAINEKKHKKRQGHIRDVAFKNNPTTIVGENHYEFDIGNNFAEEKYPYYHILQDTPYIKVKGKATKQSSGSQATISNASARNYGIISWNGKTYSKEYAKNVRGARNREWKVRRNIGGTIINKNSNEYLNIHYNYIDKNLDTITDLLAFMFNMKKARKQNSGLADDYSLSRNIDIIETPKLDIIDIFNSFDEESEEEEL